MTSPENSELKEIVHDISLHPIVGVTVYQDRAEVSRLISIPYSDLSSDSSAHQLKLTNMVSCIDAESIRVRADKSCEISEVNNSMQYKSKEEVKEGGATEIASSKLEAAKENLAEKKQDLERVKQRDNFVQGYLKKMLMDKSENNSTPTEAAELLEFHMSQCVANDKAIREATRHLKIAETDYSVAYAAYSEISSSHQTNRAKSFREVNIIFHVQNLDRVNGESEKKESLDNAQEAAAVIMRITYNVNNASWSPSYDIRVSNNEEEKKKTKNLQLTYFGVVKQNSGEDWNNCRMALSTALPAVGGTPPAPPTLEVKAKSNYQQASYRHKKKIGMTNAIVPQLQMQQQQMPQQSMMPPRLSRRLSITADELDDSDDDELESGREMEGNTTVGDGGGGSSTFQIERKSTIASDNKNHKVCIALIDLSPQFRYFMTPSLEQKAYLQVRALNSSAYPILASDLVSVFFDGSFVCKTSLKNIYPNESFSVFLGTDNTLKVSHKLLKKTIKEGDSGGFIKNRVDSRKTFQYVTQLHNTKDEGVDITLVELLPRSSDEKIKVIMLEPKDNDRDAKDNTSDGGTLSSEGQLKTGQHLRNKITNNVVWSKHIKAGEKTEVKFSYAVEWPHGHSGIQDVEII